jgi:hypothetical protein
MTQKKEYGKCAINYTFTLSPISVMDVIKCPCGEGSMWSA